MGDFKFGEIVDVVIKGVRVVEAERLSVTIKADDGKHYCMPVQAAIERVAPAEWPPQTGDLWRDQHGHVWFGQLVDSYEDAGEPFVPFVELVPASASTRKPYYHGSDQPEEVSQVHGPLTLVHREQQDGGATP